MSFDAIRRRLARLEKLASRGKEHATLSAENIQLLDEAARHKAAGGCLDDIEFLRPALEVFTERGANNRGVGEDA